MDATSTAQSSLWVLRDGRNHVAVYTLGNHEEKRGRTNIPVRVVSTYCSWTQWLEQRQKTEVQQLWSNNHHCQTENKAMELGYLPSSMQSLFTLTLPELAGVSEAVAVSMSTEHTICFPKNWKCRNTPPLNGGWMQCLIPVTAVWQLRSGSHPYWEKKKGTDAAAGLLLFTPPPPMTAETSGETCNILGSDWLQRTALGFHGLRNPNPTTFPQKAGGLRQMWPGQRRCSIPDGIQDIFHHPAKIPEV